MHPDCCNLVRDRGLDAQNTTQSTTGTDGFSAFFIIFVCFSIGGGTKGNDLCSAAFASFASMLAGFAERLEEDDDELSSFVAAMCSVSTQQMEVACFSDVVTSFMSSSTFCCATSMSSPPSFCVLQYNINYNSCCSPSSASSSTTMLHNFSTELLKTH